MPDTESRDCFGKLWDERSPECAGGLDAMYTNPETGSKVRSQCSLYDTCGRQWHATRAQERLTEIRTKQGIEIKPPAITFSLPPASPTGTSIPIKPGVPTFPSQSGNTPPRPSYTSAPPAPYTQQNPPQAQQPYYPPNRPPFQQQEQAALQPSPSQFFPAVFRPTLTLQPHESPPFLTVPEPIIANEPVWKRILYEALRAAVKGIFCQGAYTADHLTIHHSRGK